MICRCFHVDFKDSLNVFSLCPLFMRQSFHHNDDHDLNNDHTLLHVRHIVQSLGW